ncbi:MAG: ankyrin repeat domain-containing protein [Verrucomicrobiales bacterium]
MKTNSFARGKRVFGWLVMGALVWMGLSSARSAEDGAVVDAMREALYAEEVKGDVAAALQAYEAVTARFEEQRDLAATALFRQGECLRKLERPQEAAAAYRKLLTLFPDKERLVRLSRENLVALGQPVSERGGASVVAGPPAINDDERRELSRVQAMAANSPDLLFSEKENAFIAAADKGYLAVLDWFLNDQAASVKPHLDRAALSAAKAGQLKACERLLAAGASTQRLLALALQFQRWSVVRLLLDSKADVAAVGEVPATPEVVPRDQQGNAQGGRIHGPALLLALGGVSGAPFDGLTDLLKSGADPNHAGTVQPNSGGAQPVSALSLAVRSGQSVEVVRLLLDAKAEVNALVGEPGRTALMLALEQELSQPSDDLVQALLAGGANWTTSAGDGHTALHSAVGWGRIRWVEAAIKAGVDVNARTEDGVTPLILAQQRYAGYRAVAALLQAGSKIESNHPMIGNPLVLAYHAWPRTDETLHALESLLDAGADPHAAGRISGDLRRPLDAALWTWDAPWPAGVEALLKHGGRPKDIEGGFSGFIGRARSAGTSDSAEKARRSIFAAFRPLWKAAHWRDNPLLMEAVWADEGESTLEDFRRERETPGPLFAALFSKTSALDGPPSLRRLVRQRQFLAPGLQPREWEKATITRQTDGQESIIPIDVLAIAAGKASEPPLQWGDVLAVPASPEWRASIDDVVLKWANGDAEITVRLDLGEAGMVSNRPADAAPLWDSATVGAPALLLETAIRRAGIPQALLNLTATIRRTDANGAMVDVPTSNPSPTLRDGDTVVFIAPELKPSLSEEALREGVWLCPSMEGPFWPVDPMYDAGVATPLGYVLLALQAPHPGMFQRVDWSKAILRTWVAPSSEAQPAGTEPDPQEETWIEQPLMTAWASAMLRPGQILILPPGDHTSPHWPEELKAGLAKLAFDWRLQIDNAAGIPRTYRPRFFDRRMSDGQVVWFDVEPSGAEGPLLPLVRDLLALSDAVAGGVATNVDPLAAVQLNSSHWAFPDRVVSYTKPKPQQNTNLQINQQMQINQINQQPGRRRVVLPPAGGQ